MRKKSRIVIIYLIGFLIQSCDPAYPISISNQSESEIRIQAKKTFWFWNEDLNEIQLTEKDWVEFKIEPGKSVKCGMTIGGLRNKLPFSQILIITKTDTIKAESENQILEMFDKTFFGNLKKPYNLTVE